MRRNRFPALWCVNVPPELSSTGKRREMFFTSKTEAQVECDKLKARKDNFGLSLTALTPAKIAVAAECYKLLDPYDLNILDVVRSYVESHKQRIASKPFEEVFNLFAEMRQGKSRYYRYAISQTKAKFSALHTRMICEISAADLRPVLDLMPDSSRDTKMRVLRSLFNFAIKRQWMLPESNPIAQLDFSEKKNKEVETVPVDYVAGMLKHALENELLLVPFLTLGFFCGIRPDGELQKVEWRDVDLTDGVITIRPEVSKTKRRRFPQLSDNAIAWLNAYRQRGGRMEGRVVPFSPAVLRKKRRANWKAAGDTARWIKQGMRHTFCSNWLAVHEDVNKLVLLSGHTDAAVMWEHYHKGVKKAEAQRFWSIMPPGDLANVVAFQKEA
jgi:integrase